ncbi:MAG: UDP-N-acetylglucosamine 1-carboxyvinyltransferase [Parcubacteria group bacterium]|nr:UDP-N-acetylglucosamine 1-carboxyvinyltransferase [Parcubacteria group bacterium]
MAKSYKIIGGKKLKGEISLAGAKNAATKIMIASLLADSKSVLENIPQIGDVEVTLDIIKSLGATFKWLDQNTLEIDPTTLKNYIVPLEDSGKNRVPILFFGPLLHKFGQAEVPVLGGCKIGSRPVNFHIDAYTKLGAEIEYHDHNYTVSTKGLQGATITLDYPSVGTTENILLGACLAKGTTVIQNAAIEPEIEDLVRYLQAMGAIIYQDVNRTWVVEGVQKLHGAHYRIMNDRNEAVSFACLALANRGDVLIKGAEQKYLVTFLNWVQKIGGHFEVLDEGIRFFDSNRFQGVALETDVHPGFMTDWQQPFTIVLTQAEGVSIIHETVYENRFGYTDALNKMGAKIYLFKECLGSKPCRFSHKDFLHSAIIVGPTPLKGAKIEVPDLRAGFSYLIAALIAEGKSELTGIEIIERGYENLKQRLINLGADIQ